MKSKRILCMDFDGVLHAYTSGWTRADDVADDPVPGAREFLEEAVRHFEVHIYSSRSHQHGGIEAMNEWCRAHFGTVLTNKVFFPNYKPPAFLTIDDRAFCFRGAFPTVHELEDFQPWNKEQL